VKQIPKGKVSTYKIVADAAGIMSPRAIGRILNSNVTLDEVPCYRVVMSSGDVGGYKLGQKEKIQRLRKDGIEICNVKIKYLDRYLFTGFKI